jgi:hypothetical protein
MIILPQCLDVCISIISLDGNPSKIKESINYHQNLFGDIDKNIICAKELNYPFEQKKYLINSSEKFVLFDKAIKESTKDWCFLILSGLHLPKSILKKFSEFTKKESDILFPVKNKIWDFVKNPIECMLINKKFYEKVGFFGKENPEDIIKLLWAFDAIRLGATFKSIVGVKF